MHRSHGQRSRSGVALARRVSVAATLALSLVVVAVLAAQDRPATPIDPTHNVSDAPAPVEPGVFGSGTPLFPGQRICTTATQSGANADTDCENAGPSNETSIAVNPTNEMNMIGGANDYQLGINPAGHVSESVQSRAHVTFDGGKTWSEYPVSFNPQYQGTGDPSVAFDAAGGAYYATLGFRFVGPGNSTSPDVVVSHSTDGGRTWASVVAAAGTGNGTSVGNFLDKEYLTAWGHGNAIVTFTNFRFDPSHTLTSRIYSTVSHDGGVSWSAPQLISGTLDQTQGSIPVVAADGRIYVAFMNTSDLVTGRDDYDVVEVSPATGARLAGPFKVATLIDGFTDYPIYAGRSTYQDSLFRTWAAGNLAADPTNPAHLVVAWSDMRNSPTPAPADPYSAVTNSDTIVSESFNNGETWSAPVAIPLTGDQFMPWAVFDRSGVLRVGMFDRQYDPANHLYGYTLATRSGGGFTTAKLSTTLSDPTKDDRWFARNVNPAFPFATAFLGDYSNIAARPSGGVVAYWTDMRLQACFAGRCGHGQDAFFAAAQ